LKWKKSIKSFNSGADQVEKWVNSGHFKLASQSCKKELKSVEKSCRIHEMPPWETIWVLWGFQKEKRHKGSESLFTEIKAGHSPNLGIEVDLHIHKDLKSPNMKPKTSTSKQIIINLLKVTQRILKTSTENGFIT
jgi:hypothetical protein